MTATAARTTEHAGRLSTISVVLTLARFEGRQMVRHPLLWLAAIASAGLAVLELVEESPVLNRVSMTLAWTMAPMAVAVVFLAGWAVLRARGRTDDHPPLVMPTPIWLRVSGVLTGLVWPAVATFGIQLALLGWTVFRDPVTSIVWTELLVGPAFVAFAGAVSTAVTRWFPHPSTPIVALFVLAGAQVVVPYNPGNWGSEIGPAALAPIAWPENIIPYEVAFRPSGLHLGYLFGLALGFAGVALLDRVRLGGPILGAGLILVGVLGPAQLGPIDEHNRTQAMARLVGDEADLTCEEHDAITFCAMPGYEGWIDIWVATIQPMLDDVPTEAIQGIEVRQYPVHNTFLLEEGDFAGDDWWWVDPAREDFLTRDVVAVGSIQAWYTSSDLAAGVAREMIGCDPFCEEPSQQVVSLWLMAKEPRIRQNVESSLEYNDSGSVAECLVFALWEDPNADQRIRANWETLTSPDTSYEEAGEILGVEVAAGYDEFDRYPGGCP